MYIYHALINTMSAHMIHINLNIFYTHVEHSSTQTTHTKRHTERPPPPPQHTHTHTYEQKTQSIQADPLYSRRMQLQMSDCSF